MTANYVLLEKITVGAAGASSVTFSGIPQTGYTDLVIKFSARSNYASIYDHMAIFYNGDTASNYVTRWLYGDGASAASGNQTATNSIQPRFTVPGSSATASTFGNGEMYLPNYTSANYKSQSWDTVTENNATTAYAAMDAGLWSNTAAINSIQINPYFGSWIQNSTFYLYGVAKLGTTPAIVPYATGGDTIMTDGTYWYHTFLSSGTFTPQKALSCDYLVVAGGGGGANDNAGGLAGGGGGAGGLRSTVTATGGGGSLETPLSLLSNTNYTVTIGAGGPAGANRGDVIASGSNSVFSTITSLGGSAGLSNGASQVTGGSGGGGIGYQFSGAGCAGTANQGYAGGSVVPSADTPGGGGGGAGAVGGNSSGGGGNGGAGVATSISGSSVTYAGGGGGSGITPQTGGTGGSGGGGRGAGNTISSIAGTANRGGGGGGGALGFAASAGGSGIVVIRYAV